MTTASRKRNRVIFHAVVAIAAFAAVALTFDQPVAQAATGRIPNGTYNFSILGGRVQFGTNPAQRIDQSLAHPDQPPECSDGIDNEKGTFHNGFTGATVGPPASGGTVNIPIGSTDAKVDFGVGASNETANTGCINAGDNVELFDRTLPIPDPPPACGSGAATEGFIITGPLTCAGTNDSYALQNGGPTPSTATRTPQRGSVTFGNGNASTGQEKRTSAATNVAVTDGGGSCAIVGCGVVSTAASNASFSRGYQTQGTCQASQPVVGNVCLDLYVEFQIIPTGTITGTTNPDGSGTLSTTVTVQVRLTMTYDSMAQTCVFASCIPHGATCTTSLPLTGLTTETSAIPPGAGGGNLTGVRYDTTKQNFKVVQAGFSVAAFTGTNYDGGLVDLCGQLNGTGTVPAIGLPDNTFTQAELIMTTQNTSNTASSSSAGTGMPWSTTTPLANSGPNWNPVALTTVGTNGGAAGAPLTGNQTVEVNEGDLVSLDSSQSYDPAMRAFSTNTFTRTGGTAPAPPATTGVANTSINFVAQDAPAAGNTQVFTKSITADLGPSNQTQSDNSSTTIHVNNVAPTANAGPNRIVNGGQTLALTGSSVDPGDPDTPGNRGYCWTQTGGTSVGLPPCTGTPSNNRPSSGGKFTPLNVTPANATDSLVFQLVVCDKDGACSSPSFVVYETRATSANTIAGQVSDENSLPLAGATVTLSRDSTGFVASTSTDGSGAYSFGSLTAGTDYVVQATAPGYSTVYFNNTQAVGAAKRLSSAAGQANVDIPLQTTSNLGGIQGNVKDNAAANVASLNVRLYDDQGWVTQTSTDGSGNYTFTNLTPKSTYKLRIGCSVTPPGCPAQTTYVESWFNGALTGNNASLVTVNLGTTTDVGTTTIFRITGPDQRAVFNGTVTGPTNATALSKVNVRIYNTTTGAWVADGVTDGSGNYSVPVLPNAGYKLWFWTKNSALAPPAGTTARTSQWWNGGSTFINGEQYDGSGKLVTAVSSPSAGATVTVSPVLP